MKKGQCDDNPVFFFLQYFLILKPFFTHKREKKSEQQKKRKEKERKKTEREKTPIKTQKII